MPRINRCHTDDAQNTYDSMFDNTAEDVSISHLKQTGNFKRFEDSAFMEIIADDDLISDVLVDLTTKIQMFVSDSNDCHPREKDSKMEDVISNAETWQCLVDAIKEKISDQIEERAIELWRAES